MTSQVNGKVVLITGATSGIGEMTALQLGLQGAHVIIHGRSKSSCQAAIQRIHQAHPAASLDFLAGDLSALTNVKEIARAFKERYDHLDVLVNNAGAFFLQHRTSHDNVEMTMAVNHLAHFALTLELLPCLRNSRKARIINVASNAHYWARIKPGKFQMPRNYFCLYAYGNSKLANLLYTYELARRLAGTTITVNALHPGFVISRIGMNNGWFISAILKFLQNSKLLKPKTSEEGAQTSVYLATSPEVTDLSGKYFFDCKPALSSPISYDEQLARGLWKWSAQVANIDLPGQAEF